MLYAVPMAIRPPSDIPSDGDVVLRLVREYTPPRVRRRLGLTGELPLDREPAAEGWDCRMWRLGDGLAVRLPRRAVARDLIRHEQRHLPGLAAAFSEHGVAVPAPVFRGAPVPPFPHPWSIVPWIAGGGAIETPRADRSAWADRLARVLVAVHRPAPAGAPENPYRGVPLAARDRAVRRRIGDLGENGLEVGALERAWHAGLDAPAWAGPRVWIHGDLHPGNIVVSEGRLAGVIDFGDMTAGDPAYDLAIAWLAFDTAGRARFMSETAGAYDAPTWVRARAWAAGVTTALLAHSDDRPEYARLGHETIAEITLEV